MCSLQQLGINDKIFSRARLHRQLDRFLELVHIIKITGRSYRLRNIKRGELNIGKKEVEKEFKTN